MSNELPPVPVFAMGVLWVLTLLSALVLAEIGTFLGDAWMSDPPSFGVVVTFTVVAAVIACGWLTYRVYSE